MLAELEATSKAGSEGRAGWASVVGGGELTCSSAALTAGREEAVWSQSQGTLAFRCCWVGDGVLLGVGKTDA